MNEVAEILTDRCNLPMICGRIFVQIASFSSLPMNAVSLLDCSIITKKQLTDMVP